MNIGQLLNALDARLPELEWRMGILGSALSEHALPKGLFKPCLDPHPAFYIDEIKSDITHLASQESTRSAYYIANRIHQKINVLIALCRIQAHDTKLQRPLQSFTTVISTRKQWVETAEKEIASLEKQAVAMETTYKKIQSLNDVQALLNLQTELGAVKKALTLARERLNTYQIN